MAAVPVPDVIPIFPLPQTVLLPGEVLPLHIFEARYTEMVRDALASHHIIGMVQILPGHEKEQPFNPPVRDVGCAGVIARHTETEDGRFLIWLVGVERFHISQELETVTRYRLASIRHDGAEGETARQGLSLRRLNLLASLTAFLDGKMEGGEDAVSDLMRQMGQVGDEALAAAAAQVLGVTAERKQRLLEVQSIEERFDLLQRELDLALEGPAPVLSFPGKVVH